MYDVDGPFGIGVRRVTYLVSQGQKIQDALKADLKIEKHKAFIEKAIILRESAGLKVACPQCSYTDRPAGAGEQWPMCAGYLAGHFSLGTSLRAASTEGDSDDFG